MSDSTELVAVEQPQQLITIEPAEYVAQVFEPFAKRLADAKKLALSTTYDVKTTAGMAMAVKIRATFRDIRVESEKARKIRKAPILEIGKLLDSRQKEIETEIEPLESEPDLAIKAEEARKEAERQAKLAAEKARIDAIRKRIAEIQAVPSLQVGTSADAIETALEAVQAVEITLEEYCELAGEAEVTKSVAVSKLGEMLTAQRTHEAEQARIQTERAQLAKEREEAAERERQAAAERQRIADEERIARAKAQAAMLAEQEAHEARLRAEREAAEAELRKQREAEEARLAEQRAELARQQAAIDAANAERERVEREAKREAEARAWAEQKAREMEARVEAQRIADEQAAEARRVQAEKDAAEFERLRREYVE